MTDTRFCSYILDQCKEEDIPMYSMVDLDAVSSQVFQDHANFFQSWIKDKLHGDMAYLDRGMSRRMNPVELIPGAKSVLVLGFPYQAKNINEDFDSAIYARYLSGKDYHKLIKDRLEEFSFRIQTYWKNTYNIELKYKVCVDTSAVLERTWGALSGLGWIGKNTLLINKRYGSYFFLAEIFWSERSGRSIQLHRDYCGNCRRCIEACPTDAFVAEKRLDARRCISYWNLEKRGPLSLSDKEKRAMGRRLAGCDICQEVCPFNFKRQKNDIQLFHKQEDSSKEENGALVFSWKELLKETENDYRSRVKSSSLERVKPHMFRRNLAIGLSNAILETSPDKRIDFFSLRPLVERKAQEERDPDVLYEWNKCLEIFNSFKEAEGI